MTLAQWLGRRIRSPWSGVAKARAALEESRSEQPAVRELAEDLNRIHQENHITARVHRAMRGGRDQ